jgi:HCOMODA/2-hydroxy-3-carboxy-muconic semialdehyde decarboxylase
VSVRHDRSPRHFLLARSMAPAFVRRDDILTFDLDGAALDAGERRVYLERFIHAEIYRARPDVQAVVHSHSPNVIPFGVTQQTLRPIFHMCGFLGEGAALFEIRDAAGDTDMLVGNGTLGAALAAALGDRSTVLMRGHGSTVVGDSVEQAVYRAIYAEVNARLQLQATQLGPVTYLNAQEAAKSAAANDTQLSRAWELWTREVGPIE